MQIQNWSYVKQTARRMAIVARLQAKGFYDRLQSAYVFEQLSGTNGGVFYKRDGFRRPNATGQKRETRFADRPDQIHLRCIGENFFAQPELSRFQNRQPFYDVIVELDDQDRFARLAIQFEQIARLPKMKLSFRLIQQRPIDVFHRCRFEIEKFDGCLHRFSDRREEDQSQAVLARQWRDFQFRRKNPGERSFTARENVGKIVRRAKESFDPVAWPPFYKARRPTFRHLGARCSDNLLNRRALRIEPVMSRADLFDTTATHCNPKPNDGR